VLTPRTQYARSGDVYLAYQVIGDGARDIVLAADWASHLELMWEQPIMAEFVSSLTRFARVLLFDIRGTGLSDSVVSSGVSPEDWIEDVGAVMDAAGSERATLIAHGHAVQMALMAAAMHPERVEALVLINGFARLARADDYPAGLPLEAQELGLEGIRTQWGTGSLARFLAPSVAERPGVEEWWGKVERFAGSPGTAVAKMRMVLDLDVRSVLPLVSVPTLVIHSRESLYIRVGHSRYLVEHIKDARLLERDSADHWLLPEPDLLGPIEEFVTGSRSEITEQDRFLATVLFVDVVGSTQYASEFGDRSWRAALDRFEQTAGEVLRHFEGTLERATGDGVLATFAGPARAIRCASHFHDEVRRSGMEVRCGLHAGEVTRRPEGIAGLAIHIGARVCALAAPGEVLVTRTVRDLVAGSGISFEERGEHELKGVPETWTLYAATS